MKCDFFSFFAIELWLKWHFLLSQEWVKTEYVTNAPNGFKSTALPFTHSCERKCHLSRSTLVVMQYNFFSLAWVLRWTTPYFSSIASTETLAGGGFEWAQFSFSPGPQYTEHRMPRHEAFHALTQQKDKVWFFRQLG